MDSANRFKDAKKQQTTHRRFCYGTRHQRLDEHIFFFGAFSFVTSLYAKSASVWEVDVSPGTALNNPGHTHKKKGKKRKMERYGRRKVYCIRLRKDEYGFSVFGIISFSHVHYLLLFSFVFVRLSSLSHSGTNFLCDKEKEEETVECLGNEKNPVFMVRREERNKFSLVPYGDKKERERKKKKKPSRRRPSVRPVRLSRPAVGRWETVTSRRVEMNNKYAAALSCDSPFFTVWLVWKRVMCVRVKGNSFQINKSCAAEYYVIFADDPEHGSNFGSLPSR